MLGWGGPFKEAMISFSCHFSSWPFSPWIQVEQNIEFIQRKRDEVGFSPKDLSSVESFLQVCFLFLACILLPPIRISFIYFS